MRITFFTMVAIVVIASCKKETKTVIPNVKLEIVQPNNTNEFNGQYSTTPIVVRIMQAGETLPLSSTNFLFEVVANNCTLDLPNQEKAPVRLIENPDGSFSLFCYTGEKIGKQRIAIWLIDAESKERITSVETEINVIQNPEGFEPNCFNAYGNILHLEDQTCLFVGYGGVYKTTNLGLTWEYFSPYSPNEDGTNLSLSLMNKPFNFYHKPSGSIFYTKGNTINISNDQGANWKTVVNIWSYVGQLSENEFLLSNDFGIIKLVVNNNGTYSYSLWSTVKGATGLVVDNNNKLYVHTFDGLLYSSSSVNDTVLVKQNLNVFADYLYKEGNTIYSFGKKEIYRFENGTLSLIGNVPLPNEFQVFDVIKQNNMYYVFAATNSRFYRRVNMYIGTSLTELTLSEFKPDIDPLGLTKNWSCINNYLCIKNESGYVSFKKP
ncbi:MAG: hypothetical protein ACK5UI_01900 [Bacteroidota bacterium]